MVRFRPRISIVTVCYQSESTIEDTLRSVQDQTYGLEFIDHVLVDGGSTDRTLEIISHYPHAKVVSEKDRGISDAFNKGIARSSGDWVLFLNSDDYLANPDVLVHAEPYLTPDKGVVYGKLRLVSKDRRSLVDEVGTAEAWKYLAQRMTVPHPTSFFQRAYLDRYGEYSEDFKIAMDYELLLRGFKTETFGFIPEVITEMRVGGYSDRVGPIARAKEMYRARRKNRTNGFWVDLLLFAYTAVRPLADRWIPSIPLLGGGYRWLARRVRRGF